jgi:hypothetical protein
MRYAWTPESSRFLKALCVVSARVFSELPAVVSLVRAALSAQCGADCLRLQLESPPHRVAGVRRLGGS